ncbi:MAG: metallophosphoesterase [Planctomycetota bacterium]|nr:MAG: metallophosphoesterase [Planctomycetota bacterium]
MRTLIMTLLLTFVCSGPVLAAEHARGVVFDDRNHNGLRDDGEPGIAGVAVSNGEQVVLTDDDGRYELSVDDDTIVFVCKPSGWMTPVSPLGLPRFYYVHKPAGSPKLRFAGVAPTGELPDSVDFALYQREEPRAFHMVAFGDSQPASIQDVHYYMNDIVAEVAGVDAKFGVSLGDLVGNNLALFEPLNEVNGTIGLPWYYVIGNHDLNFDAADDARSDETFERVYGPTYYSFDYADVHFVVLDNVHWTGPRDGERGRYVGLFGARQLAWMENDLKHVPREKLVVCMFHIPLASVDDRDAFLDVLGDRPRQLSLAAHWHRQGHVDVSGGRSASSPAHHHFVVGTTSGSWWRGAPDEYGLPHTQMSDGTPNGWLLVRFDGDEYSWRYKAARRPWDFQMSVFAPDVVSPEHCAETQVFVNFFAGSDRARVEMRIGDRPWRPLEKVAAPDPFYVATREREQKAATPGVRVSPEPRDSTHLWRAKLGESLTPGAYAIEVRATDMFGQTYTARRVMRVARD